MGSLTPVQVTLVIIAAVAAVGVIVNVVRRGKTLAGYEEIAPEVTRLSRELGGETFRDGADLVISGGYGGVPAVVRFSNSEHTPGLHIRIPAPATFRMSVAHVSAASREGGRKLVKTGNDLFDRRFETRTDDFAETNMFLHTAAVPGLLEQLVCSRNTFLTVGKGAIELSELVVPSPDPAHHVLQHLRAMKELARLLRAMPGADRIKVAKMEREHHLAGRTAMAVGLVVAVTSVFTATRVPSTTTATNVNATVDNGIPPADALLLRDAASWRVATADDFDAEAAAWLRNQGQTPSGRIAADFKGDGLTDDVGYLLVGPNGQRRIAIIANHATGVDGEMMNVAAIARIPKSAVANIEWTGGKAPEDPLGDGLLVVQRTGDKRTSVAFFLSKNGVVSATPADYQQMSLQ